jgi:uncharacterized protein YjbJ (UPF0337 family)
VSREKAEGRRQKAEGKRQKQKAKGESNFERAVHVKAPMEVVT